MISAKVHNIFLLYTLLKLFKEKKILFLVSRNIKKQQTQKVMEIFPTIIIIFITIAGREYRPYILINFFKKKKSNVKKKNIKARCHLHFSLMISFLLFWFFFNVRFLYFTPFNSSFHSHHIIEYNFLSCIYWRWSNHQDSSSYKRLICGDVGH